MSRKKHIIWSASIALGFLILYYFVCNLPFSVKGEKMMLRKVEVVKDKLGLIKTKEVEDVLFINVIIFFSEIFTYIIYHKNDIHIFQIGRSKTAFISHRHQLIRA